MVLISLEERNRKRTPQEKAEFADLLAHLREKGFPQVNGDQTEPFLSHADGKMYDSKSAYRQQLKERGFEEVGGTQPVQKAKKPNEEKLVADIKRSMGVL